MAGNTSSGRESLDKPFLKRRRNLGQRNADGATRADRVALVLAQANTLRELALLAIGLGAPARYVEKILERDYRNSVKVMEIHRAARFFFERKRNTQEKTQRARFAGRVGRPMAGKDTAAYRPGTQYGIPPKAQVKPRT